MHVAAVLIPAALYFLLLGILNSRSTPQLVGGRTDFICLIVTFSPIFAGPALLYFGATAWTVAGVFGAVAAAAIMLAPRPRRTWAIYNVTKGGAFAAVASALDDMHLPFVGGRGKIVLAGLDVRIRLAAMPLLRNVSIRLDGDDAGSIADGFSRALAERLGSVRAPVTPMASAFLMIATGMLVAPLALFADQMPQMVRLITDLVK